MSEPRLDIERVYALTEELLRIDSPYGDETAIADWLEARFAAQSPHALVRARNSLCIVPRPLRDARPAVMLVGHVDTVPKLSDNPVRRDGPRLFGLGASDMKAADALIIDVVEQAIRRPPRLDLIAVLYAREEGPFDDSEMPAIHAAAKRWFGATGLAVCMEPTDGRIEVGCLGTSHATLTFEGQRAHSARPWQGRNAIHAVAGLLQRLEAFGKRRFEFDGFEFFETCSATHIEYRGARNVVPDLCTVNVNYRFAPGKDEASVRAQFDMLAAGEARWELTDYCPAGRVCTDNPLLDELRGAAGEPEIAPKQAWTDVGRLSHLGIDAINWGPGATSQAHQAGEWVSLAKVAECAGALWRFLF